MAYDPNRLYAILQNTGLSTKDNTLYQLLRELIGATTSNASNITTIVNNPSSSISNNLINQFLLGGDSDSGSNSEVGPPGPQGIEGTPGIQGPLGPMGAIIYPPDAEDGDMYPPQQGPQGNSGPTGSAGPIGPTIICEDGIDGEDGLHIITNNASLSIATALVATSETQASGAAYGDLATSGPSVTLTTGTSVLVWIGCLCSRAGVGNSAYCSPAISGATTQAASDTYSGSGSSSLSTGIVNLANVFAITGLTAGSNTFKLQYRNDGGSTWTFRNRTIVVLAL